VQEQDLRHVSALEELIADPLEVAHRRVHALVIALGRPRHALHERRLDAPVLVVDRHRQVDQLGVAEVRARRLELRAGVALAEERETEEAQRFGLLFGEIRGEVGAPALEIGEVRLGVGPGVVEVLVRVVAELDARRAPPVEERLAVLPHPRPGHHRDRRIAACPAPGGRTSPALRGQLRRSRARPRTERDYSARIDGRNAPIGNDADMSMIADSEGRSRRMFAGRSAA